MGGFAIYFMELSASASLGGNTATVSLTLGGEEEVQERTSRPPVRPTERDDLERNISQLVTDEYEAMCEELREEDRIQEGEMMNDMELNRLKLKYKYKYKYKYEVKRSQDRSTPLLGDSWDLDPALASGELYSGADSAAPATQDLAGEEEAAEPQPPYSLSVRSEQVTQGILQERLGECRKALDALWTQMAGPPPNANTMDTKQLRMAMRESRQSLLPVEHSLKELLTQMKALDRVFKEAQKDTSPMKDDLPHTAHTDPNRGNDKVQKALANLNQPVLNNSTLTAKRSKICGHS